MSNPTQPSSHDPKPTPPAFPSNVLRRVNPDSVSSVPAGFPKAHPSPAPQYTYQEDNEAAPQDFSGTAANQQNLQEKPPKNKIWIWVTVIAVFFVLLLIIGTAVVIPIAVKMFSPQEKSALDAATVSVLKVDASDGGSVELSALAKNPFQYTDVNLSSEKAKFAVSEDFSVEQGMCSSSSSVAVDLPGNGSEDVRNQYVNIILGDGVTDAEDPSKLPNSQVVLYDMEGSKIPTTLYSHTINVGTTKLPATTFIAQSDSYKNRLASISVACSSVDTLEAFVSDVVNGKSPYKLLVTIK